MSMALAHFAFGAAMTTMVVSLLVPVVWYPRTVVLAGGGWAMVPDFHWVSPVARQHLYAFHSSGWADVFWLHRTLDRVDPGDSKAVAAVCVALFIVATALAEWRSYRAPATVRSVYEAHRDDEPSR